MEGAHILPIAEVSPCEVEIPERTELEFGVQVVDIGVAVGLCAVIVAGEFKGDKSIDRQGQVHIVSPASILCPWSIERQLCDFGDMVFQSRVFRVSRWTIGRGDVRVRTFHVHVEVTSSVWNFKVGVFQESIHLVGDGLHEIAGLLVDGHPLRVHLHMIGNLVGTHVCVVHHQIDELISRAEFHAHELSEFVGHRIADECGVVVVGQEGPALGVGMVVHLSPVHLGGEQVGLFRKLQSERLLIGAIDIPRGVASSSHSGPLVAFLDGAVVVADGDFGEVIPFIFLSEHRLEAFQLSFALCVEGEGRGVGGGIVVGFVHLQIHGRQIGFLREAVEFCLRELIAESLCPVGRIAICPGIGDWCERSKRQDRRSQRSKNLCHHVFMNEIR